MRVDVLVRELDGPTSGRDSSAGRTQRERPAAREGPARARAAVGRADPPHSRHRRAVQGDQRAGHQEGARRSAARTIVNLFFEASTRTRISFEFAEKRLSADTVNVAASGPACQKGETLVDTARNLEAMRIDMVVIRHGAPGAARFLAERIESNVINAGDGTHEHPTQGLLDLLTLRDRFGSLAGRRVCIVRRRAPLARGALQHLGTHEARRRGRASAGRARCCRARSTSWASRCSTGSRRRSSGPRPSTSCACSSSGCRAATSRRCANTIACSV